ncbi:MAG: anti-sigma factor [Alphaproteobacteria bacterium]|nr:anti-sigma factor [Alphaproteobacteria bacterium]
MALDETCDRVLLVQAEFDGELDAAEAAALAAHRAQCPVCQAAAAQLTTARALVGGELYEPAPEAVRRQVLARLAAVAPQTKRPTPLMARVRPLRRWGGIGASFGLGAACAAALLLLLVTPGRESLTEQVVASHIRALQPGHLEDVPSSDQHTVKPWFDGRIDFAPPVKNLAAAGFPLLGGRLDYMAGRPVAALVYGRDKHIIDLYVWPAAGGAGTAPAIETTQRQGYNIVHWSAAGMTLWAVSDVEMNQLRDFAEAWLGSA